MKNKKALLVVLFQFVFLLSPASHADEHYLKILFGEFTLKIKTDWKVEVLRHDDKKLEFFVFQTETKKQLASIQMLPFDLDFIEKLKKELDDGYSIFEHKDIVKIVCYYKQTYDEATLYLKTIGNILVVKGKPSPVAKMLNLNDYCDIKSF